MFLFLNYIQHEKIWFNCRLKIINVYNKLKFDKNVQIKI